MSLRDELNDAYFEWMVTLVCEDRFSDDISYRRLFSTLHNTEFRYSIPRDVNRFEDGISLRHRFVRHHTNMQNAETYLAGRCSVLEMMVALALRIEETIMTDTTKGDRTGQWFWEMINSLGLGGMMDSRFDRNYVEKVIHDFLTRQYSPNGKGGLFTVRNCTRDLRKVELWYQMCYYLDTIT